MAAVLYTLALVATIHLYFFWISSIVLIVGGFWFALREQRRSPIIVVFRRFGSARAHSVLSHLAAGTASLGRTVWLLDASFPHGGGFDRNIHPFAIIAAGAGLLGYAIATMVVHPNVGGALWVAYCITATITWLIVLGGGRGTLLLSFYGGIIVAVFMLPATDYGLADHHPWLFGAARIGLVTFVFAVLHKGADLVFGSFPSLVNRHRRLFFRNIVETPRDLAQLVKETRSRMVLWPRFLMNAPVLIHDVWCVEATWRTVVSSLLCADATALAIVDLTGATPDAALMWEITECRRQSVPTFFLADENQHSTLEQYLKDALGEPTPVFALRTNPKNPELLADDIIDDLAGQIIALLRVRYPDFVVTRDRSAKQ